MLRGTGFVTLVVDRLTLARARLEGVEAVARVVSASAALDAECIAFMHQGHGRQEAGSLSRPAR